MSKPYMYCPVCGEVYGSWYHLAWHCVEADHIKEWSNLSDLTDLSEDPMTRIECWCGEYFFGDNEVQRDQNFAEHLESIGAENLNMHYVIESLARKTP